MKYHVVWCLTHKCDPATVYATWGAVRSFDTLAEAKAFAKAGHPMHKGWYRVVVG